MTVRLRMRSGVALALIALWVDTRSARRSDILLEEEP